MHNGTLSFTYFTRVLPYKIAYSLSVVSGPFFVMHVPGILPYKIAQLQHIVLRSLAISMSVAVLLNV